jgi:hypothetical protein
MKKHVLPSLVTGLALFMFSTGTAALGALENPQPGGIETGIGAITGWHCTSKNIEVRVDGVSAGLAGTGTPRLDTAGVCGGRSDTGFSFLWNYALLHGGIHKVDVYADGVPFGTATFQVGYLGAEFLTGLSSAHRITDFPVRGQGANVVWQQSKQNFVIAGVQALTSGSLVGTYSIRNAWLQDSTGLSVSTLQPNVSISGTLTFRADGTVAVTFTLTANGQPPVTDSTSGTYIDGGYYINDGGEIELVIERGETLTLLGLFSSGATSWATLVLSATRNPVAATAYAAAAHAATAEVEAAGIGAASSGIGGALQAIGAEFARLAH